MWRFHRLVSALLTPPAHNQVILAKQKCQNSSLNNRDESSTYKTAAIGVLGKLAMALCAVPLLTPVSLVIWLQERP
jgi:hypothetical protein